VLSATISLLLEAGTDPKASDEVGNNALHLLAGTWLEVAEQEADFNELITEIIRRCKDCCKMNLYQVNANKETTVGCMEDRGSRKMMGSIESYCLL